MKQFKSEWLHGLLTLMAFFCISTAWAQSNGTIKTVEGNTTTWDFTKVTQAQGTTLSGWTDNTSSTCFSSKAYGTSYDESCPTWCEGIKFGYVQNNTNTGEILVYYNGNGVCFNGNAGSIKVTIPEGANTIEVYSEQTILTTSHTNAFLRSIEGGYVLGGVTAGEEIEFHRFSGATYITKVITREAPSHAVKYVAGDGGTGEMSEGSLSEYAKMSVPSPTFTAEDGYTFYKWYCSADGKEYDPGDNFYMSTKDVTFTAEYTPIAGKLDAVKTSGASYTAISLTNGNTFKAGDVLKINITKAATTGTLTFYADQEGKTSLYATGATCVKGENQITLPTEAAGYSTLYLVSTDNNPWNAVVSSIEVVRPIIETRYIKANGYGTICLPYNATSDGIILLEMSGKVMESGVAKGLQFDYVGGSAEAATNHALEAGHAYVYYATADVQTFTCDMNSPEATVPSMGNGTQYVGTFAQINDLLAVTGHAYYFLYQVDNLFHPACAKVKMPAYRCYIKTTDFSDVKEAGTNGAPAVVFGIFEEDGANQATAIEAIHANDEDGKFMKNGQLYIRHNGRIYNVAGQLVK